VSDDARDIFDEDFTIDFVTEEDEERYEKLSKEKQNEFVGRVSEKMEKRLEGMKEAVNKNEGNADRLASDLEQAFRESMDEAFDEVEGKQGLDLLKALW
jgi:hypothetical protein